jgi:Flp pilus assembly protein TadG
MFSGSDRGRSEAGQATVELVLVLPVVILFALFVGQVGLVVRDSVLVHHVAREAAREAAVDPSDGAARAAAARASKLDSSNMSVSLSGGRSKGDHITARVTYFSETKLPLIGRLVPDVGLQAEVTMRVE